MKEGYKYWIGIWASLFLGMIFIVAGVGKLLLGSDGFAPAASSSALLPTLAIMARDILPYVEIIVGGLLVFGVFVKYATVLASLLICGFVTQNLTNIYQGSGNLPCDSCFGAAGALTAYSALMIDGLMVIMVISIFLCTKERFLNKTPWFARKGVA